MAIINKGMSRRSFLGLTGSVAAVAGLGHRLRWQL